MPTAESLTIREPDDWHLHLRDDDMLALTADFSARQFARAIIMPNLVPPVTTIAAAEAYRERILGALPAGRAFTPLMTAYLTDTIDPDEIAAGHARGVFTACKLYPAGATTNSDSGVTAIGNIHKVLERMQAIGMPLLVHGEVTSADIDIFDREAVFIDRVLQPQGVAVVIEASHQCMTTRGIHKPGADTVTSHMLGAFRTDPSTRREFLAMIRND